jgi:hypothetical protein
VTQPVSDTFTNVPNQGTTPIRVFLCIVPQTVDGVPGAIAAVNTEGAIAIDPNTLQPALLVTPDMIAETNQLLREILDTLRRMRGRGKGF